MVCDQRMPCTPQHIGPTPANPTRTTLPGQLRLGFDTAGRLLEIIVLHFDSGHELIIHAMKARTAYLNLLD